jgi:hypothetical protein
MSRRIVRLIAGMGLAVVVATALQAAQVGKGGITPETFLVPMGCRISTATTSNATLADLKTGEMVNVRYEKQGETLVADRIVELLPHSNSTHHSKPPVDPTHPPLNPENTSRLHGTITSVNLQARTITIEQRGKPQS